MKYFILILLVFSNFYSSSQTYSHLLRQNTTWEQLQGDASTICTFERGQRLYIDADTVILGTTYTIVNANPVISQIQNPFCPPYFIDNNIVSKYAFMREDTLTQKVFIFDTNQNIEYLLYDFSLQDGDTLQTTYGNLIGTPSVVDSVRNITLSNGSIRKIFYLNIFDNFYIESIGGSKGLNFPCIDVFGYALSLTCVKENNINLYGNQCLGIVGVKEENPELNKITLTFNPIDNSVTLISQLEFENANLTLSDLNGKVVLSKNFSNFSKTLFLEHINDNIYCYSIQFKNYIVNGKLVVLH
jgi:hypothetical protein